MITANNSYFIKSSILKLNQVWSIAGDELEAGGSLKTNNKLTTCVASTEKLISSVGEEGHLQVT